MRKTILVLTTLLLAVSCSKPCNVIWTEGETDASSNVTVHKMEIQNPPAGTDWKIWFCQFRAPIEMAEGSQGEIRHISGTLYLITPTVDTKGEVLTLVYKSRALVSRNRAPEGFYLEKNGEKAVLLDVEYNYLPCEPIHSFEYNHVATSVTDMIPQLKKVELSGEGTTDVNTDVEAVIVEGQVPGWYRITLDGNTKVEASDADGAYWAKMTLSNIIRNAGGSSVENMTIEDWPDLGHRGIMLDVSRNFTDKAGVMKLIDIISHYRANVLHLHFGDDEGWRIAIDGLPELTEYGAFRGLPVLNEDGSISEPDALQPSYSGSLDRNDVAAPGNGYYSHDDFVEILKYATAHHVHVIPEFDSPGHSRAAVKSMEKRYELTGDDTYRLYEPGDASVYESVQDYTDNTINVALPSTYAFVEKVFDGLISMYQEAGAPLDAIHVGGDEVPDGVWTESEACRKLMEEKGWDDIYLLKGYFMSRVMEIAASKGVKVAGWQEITEHFEADTYLKMKERLLYTNTWTVSHGKEQMSYNLANNGINVVISLAPNAYADMSYNDNKLERGHSWAGYVDERRSFSLLPYNIYNSVRWDDKRQIVDISNASAGKEMLTESGKTHIVGVQAQLWAETLRNFDHVTYYLFPKVLGILERGWNANPEWAETTVSDDPAFMSAFDKFYSIIVDCEMPYYDEIGIDYHKN